MKPRSRQIAVQEAEGRQHSPDGPWHPKVHLQWRAAGYAAAMEEVWAVAADALRRDPGADQRTYALSALHDVLVLADAVIELRDWEGPEGSS